MIDQIIIVFDVKQLINKKIVCQEITMLVFLKGYRGVMLNFRIKNLERPMLPEVSDHGNLRNTRILPSMQLY